MTMYSLHDITSVCPKIEPVDSDEVESNEDENLSNHSDGHTNTFGEGFPMNNITHVRVSEYNTTVNGNTSIHERTTGDIGPYNNVSITQTNVMVPEQTTVNNTSTNHTGISTEIPEIQISNAYTMVPMYANNGHEALYYPVSTTESALDTQKSAQAIHTNNSDSYERMFLQQNGALEGLPKYQSSIYGTIPYDRVDYKGGFLPYQGLAAYSGTHRALTASELGIQPKPCCQCSCHFPVSPSPHAPTFELKSQRPSVIMVPSKSSENSDSAFWGASSKKQMESTARRLVAENEKLRRDLQQNGFNGMVDSDSSDEEEKPEKYFRVNIDGTTARFKLSKEDWERMPINTFPSGGRLLSGDWTRIFLEKVKETNPWCSLRFKNNHVRSQNSRKIHSAVFFRGGAECKRPECNVKVRFVIQKEKGKYVDVTYVGNVCHSSQPDGGHAQTRRKGDKSAVRPPSSLLPPPFSFSSSSSSSSSSMHE